jgi:hypothetical protein
MCQRRHTCGTVDLVKTHDHNQKVEQSTAYSPGGHTFGPVYLLKSHDHNQKVKQSTAYGPAPNDQGKKEKKEIVRR